MGTCASMQGERDLGPFREAVEWLATIPGVSDLTAQVILSEIGPRKAICAGAASMLTTIDHMLKTATAYADPGPDHVRKAAPATRAMALVRQIERLGSACGIKPVEQVSI